MKINGINRKAFLSQEFILVLLLAISYGVFTFISLYYKLGKYFVFGNILGLVIIIYQMYLLVKPVSKKSLLKDISLNLKNYTKNYGLNQTDNRVSLIII